MINPFQVRLQPQRLDKMQDNDDSRWMDDGHRGMRYIPLSFLSFIFYWIRQERSTKKTTMNQREKP